MVIQLAAEDLLKGRGGATRELLSSPVELPIQDGHGDHVRVGEHGERDEAELVSGVVLRAADVSEQQQRSLLDVMGHANRPSQELDPVQRVSGQARSDRVDPALVDLEIHEPIVHPLHQADGHSDAPDVLLRRNVADHRRDAGPKLPVVAMRADDMVPIVIIRDDEASDECKQRTAVS